MTENLRQAVDAIAEDQGKTFSDVCRELIEQGVNKNPDRQRSLLGDALMDAWIQLSEARDANLVKGVDALISALQNAQKQLSEGKSDLKSDLLDFFR